MLALAGKLAGPARRSATIAWVSGARLGSSFSSTSPARAQEAADAEGGGERPAAAARTSTPAVEFRRADLHSKWGGAASRLPQASSSSSSADLSSGPGGSPSKGNSPRSGDSASSPASAPQSPSPASASATADSSTRPSAASQQQLAPPGVVDRAAVGAQAAVRPVPDATPAPSTPASWESVLQYEYPSPTFEASSRTAQAVQESKTKKAELVLADASSEASTPTTPAGIVERAAEAAQAVAAVAAEKRAIKAARKSARKAEKLAKAARQGASVKLSSLPISFSGVQKPGGQAILVKVPANAEKKTLDLSRSLPGSALSTRTLAQRSHAAKRVGASGWPEVWSTTFDGKEARDKLKLVVPSSKRPPVARLAHSLDRALFNPGVHLMRDTRTNVYNFDERIRILPHPDEIDLKRFPAYVTASKDQDLVQLAAETKSRFFGSTSTLTAALAHIWFLIGGWRPVDLSGLTTAFIDKPDNYPRGITQPAAIYLRYDAERDTYGVDNDKTNDPPGHQRILSNLGKVMEKLLTTTVEGLDRFRKDAPPDAVSHEERHAREAYHYTQGGSMLMRSQLDGYDERLPGTGIFDIKTRATASIRFDIENHEEGQHYMMDKLHGVDSSFERERYDMMRSAWLKYGLQCRIGGMDGIFVAYHSTRYVQGFEYIPLEAMDRVLYGSKAIGDQSFGISVGILERIFELAAESFPKQSLTVVMQTPENTDGEMVVVVQPLRDDLPAAEMPTAGLRVKTTSFLGGSEVRGSLPYVPDDLAWSVRTTISRCPEESVSNARAQLKALRADQAVFKLGGKSLPTGKTQEEMQALFRQRWEAEVADPDGEFASFAYRRATLAEARKAAATNGEAGDVEVTYPLPMVKASPPEMRFPPPGKMQEHLRKLSREAQAREAALVTALAGKPVQHFQQQPTHPAPVVQAP